MSKCPKCDYDPDDLILNEMKSASVVYNVLKDPSYCGERAVPIEKACQIARKYASPNALKGA